MKNLTILAVLLLLCTFDVRAQRLSLQLDGGQQQQVSKGLVYRDGADRYLLDNAAQRDQRYTVGLSFHASDKWELGLYYRRHELSAYYASAPNPDPSSSFRAPTVGASWVGNAWGLRADRRFRLSPRWSATAGLHAELDRYVPREGRLFSGNPNYTDVSEPYFCFCCFGRCDYSFVLASSTTDVALGGQLALAYRLNRRISFALGGQFSRGLLPMRTIGYSSVPDAPADFDIRRQTLSVDLGVRYAILR